MLKSPRLILLSLPALALLGGCGDAAQMPEFNQVGLPIDGSNINGVYVAELTAINTKVSDNKGSATIIRQGDRLRAMVKMTNGTPYTWHPQKIYLGSRCPTQQDDQNGDGYIDVKEGEAVYGNAILPLDGDLHRQDAGKNLYPSSSGSGEYFYERSANFTQLFNDLKDLDPDFLDDLAKLNPEAGLSVEGAVIVIQGADEWTNLPPSVASRGTMKHQSSLPVACGVFKRVTQLPQADAQPPSVEPTPEPMPEPTPLPDADPQPSPSPDTDDEMDEDEDDDNWVDRVVNWWRERWRGVTRN